MKLQLLQELFGIPTSRPVHSLFWDTNMAYVKGANGGTIFSVNY